MIWVKTKQNYTILNELHSPHRKPVYFSSNYLYSVPIRLKTKRLDLCPKVCLGNAVEAEQYQEKKKFKNFCFPSESLENPSLPSTLATSV